jgi:hypothetical protein
MARSSAELSTEAPLEINFYLGLSSIAKDLMVVFFM